MAVLAGAAVTLVVSRFIPVLSGRGELLWTWSGEGGTVFRVMVWPMLAAGVFAAGAFLPAPIRQQLPPSLFSWAPFMVAFLGAGFTYAAVPILYIALQMNGGRFMPGGLVMVAWTYPLLVAGMLRRVQDRDDIVARVLIGLGGGLVFIGGMTEVGDLFEFEHMPALLIIHNILAFFIVLGSLASVAFALPSRLAPALAKIDGLAPLAGLVLVAWMPLSVLLVALSMGTSERFELVNLPLMLLHMGVVLFGFVGVLLVTMPGVADSLKRLFVAARAIPEAPAQGIEQQIAALDAEWARGGMTAEQYHERRNAILASLSGPKV